MASKDWRDTHERFVKHMRNEHERRTGHTPTDTEQRKIEREADKVAHNANRIEEKKKK